MTDRLEADVERWLAEEVRTTWPGKSGDCCDTDERAELAEWFAGQIRAFEAWLIAQYDPEAIQHHKHMLLGDLTGYGYGAVCLVTASEPPNSTQTPQEPNREGM